MGELLLPRKVIKLQRCSNPFTPTSGNAGMKKRPLIHSVTDALGTMTTQRAVACTMMMISLLETSAALVTEATGPNALTWMQEQLTLVRIHVPGTMSTLIHAECMMMMTSRLMKSAALAMVVTGNSVASTTISRLPIPSVMD